MDQEYTYTPDEAQPPRYQKSATPFADSPYETPFAPRQEAPVAPKPQKQKRNGKGMLALVIVLALVAAGCAAAAIGSGIYWNSKLQSYTKAMDNKISVLQGKLDNTGNSSGSDVTITQPVVKEGMTPGQVYDKNVKAVVAISNQSTTTNIYGQVSKTASSGSGFVISEDGYIVTNYHVVQGATTLDVITWDSETHRAELIGFDATNDLAVLKIDATGIPYAAIGSSDAMKVGDQVAAIGNPLGELTSTLTVGYISAKDRMVRTDGSAINMIQTDAAINSGNSGGPLFNMAGEVIGITTAKYTGTSNSGATIEGIGFAIPMDDVAGMVEDLISHGYITGAYLGVMVQDMDSEDAQMYNLPLGAHVVEVTEGSCAEKAGIQAKDIIVDIGGHTVRNISELTRALRKLEAGQTTTVTVYRGGAELHLDITLDQKPQTNSQEGTQEQPQTTEPQTQQPYEEYPDFINPEDFFGSFFPFFGG